MFDGFGVKGERGRRRSRRVRECADRPDRQSQSCIGVRQSHLPGPPVDAAVLSDLSLSWGTRAAAFFPSRPFILGFIHYSSLGSSYSFVLPTTHPRQVHLHRSTTLQLHPLIQLPPLALLPSNQHPPHHQPAMSNEYTNGHTVNGTNGDFPSLSGSTTAPAPQAVATSAGSGLSAAQRLQQAHEQQQDTPSIITEDPFPPFALTEDPFPVSTSFDSAPAPAPLRQPKSVDISDESAFPSLGGPANAGKKAATWGSGGGAAAQRIKQQDSLAVSSPSSRPATPSSAGGEDAGFATRSSVVSTTVQLLSSEIHVQAPTAGSGFAIGRGRGTFSNDRQSEPTSVGEVIKLLMKRHPTVTIEASNSRQHTTFIIKGKGADAEDKVAQVKRELLGRLAKKVSIDVQVPAGLRGFIVGAKGEYRLLASRVFRCASGGADGRAIPQAAPSSPLPSPPAPTSTSRRATRLPTPTSRSPRPRRTSKTAP